MLIITEIHPGVEVVWVAEAVLRLDTQAVLPRKNIHMPSGMSIHRVLLRARHGLQDAQVMADDPIFLMMNSDGAVNPGCIQLNWTRSMTVKKIYGPAQ